MWRGISKNLLLVVVAFWVLSEIAYIATVFFDPINSEIQFSWHIWAKRMAFALFWIGVTLLSLIWYREHPLRRGALRTQLLITSLLALLITFAYLAYFGLIIVLMNGGKLAFTQALGRVWSLDLLYQYFRVWQVVIAVNAFYYYRHMSERERESERLQLRIAEMQLMLFRAQLEPHFLFNTLNSIAALVRLKRNEAAIDALNQLGSLLRGVLEVGEQQRMPWHWELEFTQRYIALQTLRFADKLRVNLTADTIASNALFPVMLLQPLIENAIHHGKLNDGEVCVIDIRVTSAQTGWQISVRNDVGMRSSHQSRGVGLRNVKARLQVIYGDAVPFEFGIQDGVFTAIAVLPEPRFATELRV